MSAANPNFFVEQRALYEATRAQGVARNTKQTQSCPHKHWRRRRSWTPALPTTHPTRHRPTFGGACGMWTVTDRPCPSSTSRPLALATDRSGTPLRMSRAWEATGHSVPSGPVCLSCSTLPRRRLYLHFTGFEPCRRSWKQQMENVVTDAEYKGSGRRAPP